MYRLAKPETITQNDEVRIVLVGKTGVGKSAAANTILGRKAFKSRISSSSVTSICDKDREKVDGKTVAVVDTPGVFDTKNQDDALTEIKRCICLSSPGPHVFLVVLQLGRFTPEEQETVKIIKTTFGVEAEKYTMALFTHGDMLEGESIEGFVGESEELQKFIHTCGGGYHVFNNKDVDRSQVTQLLEKIMRNGRSHYTNEMFQQAERAIQEEINLHNVARDQAERQNRFMKGGALMFGTGGIALFGAVAFKEIGTAVRVAVAGPVGGAVGAVAGAGVGYAVNAYFQQDSEKKQS